MQNNTHKIKTVEKGSAAWEAGIRAGDQLIAVNGEKLEDIFDYHYFTQDETLSVTIQSEDGSQKEINIEKEYDEDLGIIFENGLMDDYKSCSNKCIFCFIDQMPPGMRETLYFKDDDSRLSFLQGNYVTLTNMKKEDMERIIRYRLAPINVSVHTTNPALRCEMLHNRFAGEALDKIKMLYDAGIEMNGQIVLCKGVNDGLELERTISDLAGYLPFMQSLSVVPVGLSKYRDGLYPLEPFEKEDAKEVLNIIHKWQDICFEKWGRHFVQAGDEWYLLAGEPLPNKERYDGYIQLENGVGMLRLLQDEFAQALEEDVKTHGRNVHKRQADNRDGMERKRNRSVSFKKIISNLFGKDRENIAKEEVITIATGKLASPFLEDMVSKFNEFYPQKKVQVIPIRNDFFGERITVSGLLTGKDLISQLSEVEIGDRLLLPGNLLRMGEETLLDDMTVSDIENALQIRVDIVKSSGQNLLDALKGVKDE